VGIVQFRPLRNCDGLCRVTAARRLGDINRTILISSATVPVVDPGQTSSGRGRQATGMGNWRGDAAIILADNRSAAQPGGQRIGQRRQEQDSSGENIHRLSTPRREVLFGTCQFYAVGLLGSIRMEFPASQLYVGCCGYSSVTHPTDADLTFLIYLKSVPDVTL